MLPVTIELTLTNDELLETEALFLKHHYIKVPRSILDLALTSDPKYPSSNLKALQVYCAFYQLLATTPFLEDSPLQAEAEFAYINTRQQLSYLRADIIRPLLT